ncbi:AraC family transcriptional regulator [Pseudonocardia nematodicida]|uniref:AraC family transcriptional regulator n=1 Tax=Pseudonocardia nematodicida TaxID=1206997 RepID=A0ABV1K6E9_9PSEU
MAVGSLTRASALRGLPGLVDELGGDGEALLARFRIPVEAVEDTTPGPGPAAHAGPGRTGRPAAGARDPEPDALLSTRAVARVLEAGAAELGCPDLGLRLAERQGPEILGPLAVAVQHSATLGDALDCASRYLYVHSPVLHVASVADPDGVPGVLGLEYGSTEPLPPQVADLGLGVIHRISLMLAGGPYGLRSVHLPHAGRAGPARYREFFGADAHPDRPAAVLRVPADLVRRPLAGGDETVRALAIDYLETHFDRPGRTVTDRVRTAVDRTLGSGPVRIDAVAGLLRVHPRTLQRHLAAEGTTFERIVDEVRRDTAERLITRTALPFTQVAAMVGLTEQSALTRATRRWFGIAPRRLRRDGAVPGPPADARVQVSHPRW